jgi:hypothetical protein
VVFISFMLQQRSQADQAKASELQLTRRKNDDETAQIRARLLYSAAQKKFELQLLADTADVAGDKTYSEVCGTSASDKDGEKQLQEFRGPNQDPAQIEEVRRVISRLYDNNGFERTALVHLLRDTNFGTRVSQEMAGRFLENELKLHSMGPLIFDRTMDLLSAGTKEAFCAHIGRLRSDRHELIEAVVNLQLATCGAFALVGLPSNEAREKAASMQKLIDSFQLRSGDEEKLVADLRSSAGAVDAEFQACMSTAGIKFGALRE